MALGVCVLRFGQAGTRSVAKAGHEMVIDQTRGLHVCVHGGAADELEAASLQFPA